MISTGHNNLISLNAMVVTSHEDLRSQVKFADRNCYFSDEYQLILHKNYTQVRNQTYEITVNLLVNKCRMIQPRLILFVYHVKACPGALWEKLNWDFIQMWQRGIVNLKTDWVLSIISCKFMFLGSCCLQNCLEYDFDWKRLEENAPGTKHLESWKENTNYLLPISTVQMTFT